MHFSGLFLFCFFSVPCDSKFWQKRIWKPYYLLLFFVCVLLIKSYMSCWIYLMYYPWKGWSLVKNIGWYFSLPFPHLTLPLFTLLCPLKNWHRLYKDHTHRSSCPVASSLVWSVRGTNNRLASRRGSLWNLFLWLSCWDVFLPKGPTPLALSICLLYGYR